jgi:hypothetical protein
VAQPPDGTNPSPGPRHPSGGIIHTYQKYDPKEFPSPTTPPPDVASAAFEHMLQFGSMRDLSPEELARAIHLDPSMFPMLGPSLESIAASLKERKRKILETYETETVQHSALKAKEAAARDARPPKDLRGAYSAAMKNEQLHELERIYYKVADGSEFASDLIRSIERLGEKYQVEELASKYEFTGRESMTVPEALEIKAELELIDKLLEQLKDAAKNAQLAIIDQGAGGGPGARAFARGVQARAAELQDFSGQAAAGDLLDAAGFAQRPARRRRHRRWRGGDGKDTAVCLRRQRHAHGHPAELRQRHHPPGTGWPHWRAPPPPPRRHRDS